MWTMNFQMFNLDLEKAEEPEIKLPTSAWSSKKQESSRKTTTSALLTMPKHLTVWITTNCGQFLKRCEYHLTCLLRNLYAGQEATVRIGHGTTDWFQIGKGVCQGCILSPCLFNFYAEYIMRNACASSIPAFLMMYSAYTVNKHSDSIQPWYAPFPIWNQSVVPCPVLTVASWPAYRFLKMQVRWSDIPISWRIFHILLWFTQSKTLA